MEKIKLADPFVWIVEILVIQTPLLLGQLLPATQLFVATATSEPGPVISDCPDAPNARHAQSSIKKRMFRKRGTRLSNVP